MSNILDGILDTLVVAVNETSRISEENRINKEIVKSIEACEEARYALGRKQLETVAMLYSSTAIAVNQLIKLHPEVPLFTDTKRKIKLFKADFDAIDIGAYDRIKWRKDAFSAFR